MIEINETKPVEASLTIVLRGDDVRTFREMISSIANGNPVEYPDALIADKIWMAL